MSWNALQPKIRRIAVETLTERQMEVWTLYLAGCGQRRIATMLDLERATVREHLDAIHRRLRRHGVHRRADGTYYLEEATAA